MNQNLQKIFKGLKDVQPPEELEGRIFRAIAVESSRKVARKLIFARTGLAASFGLMAYTLSVFGKTFLQSDFWSLVKLAFSDTGIIVKNFSNFSISLLETLPVLEISLMLAPVFVLMMMASWYFKFGSNNFKHVT